ncbi:MAG TPA: HAMP domain-containing sensor histidine kinase [Candidatus Dormibacteraeota bacterium]
MIKLGSSSPTPERPYPDRQAAELLPHVLEALPVGIGLFELRGDEFTFRYGNREFAHVLGLERTPAEGVRLDEIFYRGEHDAIVELFQMVRFSGEPQSYFSAEGDRGTTNQIWNIDAYPVLDGGAMSHVMVLAEQSREKLEARHRHQQEADRLRQKAEHLAELEKAKSEFLRLASHELRGPAATLTGYLSMIGDESLGPVPQKLRPVVPVLQAKARQISLLANEMVEAARLEDRPLQLERKRIDLRELVRRTLQMAGTTATPKHRLRFDDTVGRELWVMGDLMRLEIVVNNLVDNAIKYSPRGGDVITALSTDGGLALVKVSDTGIGIAAEGMSRLFVRFSRLGQLADVPGTGLGLYLARELARLHGGDISVVSTPGLGSEFTLSLPLEARSSPRTS